MQIFTLMSTFFVFLISLITFVDNAFQFGIILVGSSITLLFANMQLKPAITKTSKILLLLSLCWLHLLFATESYLLSSGIYDRE